MTGLGARAIVTAVAIAVATPACAGIEWHPNLLAARAAAAESNKHVLVVFTASWSERGIGVDERALATEEAAAVVSACFEPVRLDVDDHSDLARKLGVVHVPKACVLAGDDTVLTSFECPEDPAQFVAAAARAAQMAAQTVARRSFQPPTGRRSFPGAEAFEGFDTDSPATARASAAGGDGATSLVATKVRQLSDFATGHAQTVAAISPAPHALAEMPPHAPAQPGGWPAETPEQATAFMTTPPPGPSPTELAPASTAAPPAAGSTNWLAGTPAPPTPAPPTPAPPTPAPPTPSPPTPAPPIPAPKADVAALPQAVTPQSSATATDQPRPTTPKQSTWERFATAFQKPFSIFTKPAPNPALPSATVPPTMPPARPGPQPAAASVATASPGTDAATVGPDPYGSMPLGLEGYCPVTLAERGAWTEGRAQWGARHRGRTYLFAGPEQQQAFLSNPDRYAPALSGDDPVLAFEAGKSSPGRRAYGVTYQSRMYLFASPETRATFSANPDRYTARVMLAEQPASTDATRRY